MNFPEKKNIFSEKNEKNYIFFEKNWKKCIKNESLGAYDMTWTCPGHAQDMAGLIRTHMGLKNSKLDQNQPRYRHFKESKKIKKNQKKIKKNASKMSHW